LWSKRSGEPEPRGDEKEADGAEQIERGGEEDRCGG